MLHRSPHARAILTAGTLAVATAMPAAAEDPWHRVDTEHFIVFTDAAPAAGRRVGRDLERLREVLRRTTRGMDPTADVPSFVFLFRDAATFAPYDGVASESTRQVAGYFITSRDGTYIALDASAGDRGQGVVYHEYMHQVLRAGVRNVPLWLNEGLAELYSTFRASKRRAEIGHPIAAHVKTLRSVGPMSPLDLFDVDLDSADYNEGGRQGRFYASAWAITHYLMLGVEDGPQRFGRYLKAVDDGDDPRRAVLAAYDTDATGLHAGYLEHIGTGLDEFLWMAFDDPIRSGEDAHTRISDAETSYRLGDLLAHLPAPFHDAAREHLAKSIAARPDDAGAIRALARLEVRSGNLDAGIEAYRRATRLAPSDPDLLAEHGTAALRAFAERFDESLSRAATAAQVLQARDLFRRALAVDPSHLEALAGFGGTFVMGTDDPAPGIEALTRARHAAPERVDILHDLIVLLAQDGRISEARSLLDHGLRGRFDDPAAIAGAEQAIRRAEDLREVRVIEAFNRAMERYRAGNYEAAIDVLEWLLAGDPPPAARTAIEDLLEEARALATDTE